MIATEQARETKGHDTYLDAFARMELSPSQADPPWVFPIRKAGISRFAELGFPTLRDEDWRYTNVSAIASKRFKAVHEDAPDPLPADAVRSFTFGGLHAHRLVFVNGQFSESSSQVGVQPDGVCITNLREALANHSGFLEKHFARYAAADNNAFASLNAAFFQDGGFVRIPAGVRLAQPIHLLFVSTNSGDDAAQHPRNLILAERDSQATVVETYVSLSDAPYFTNAVTEVVLADGAFLEFCKYQDENLAAFHIAALHAQLGRSAHFRAHSLAAGARISRNNIRVKLDGEGIDCILNGLYLTKGDQLADHHMIVEHAKPHCNSHEYFNGILDDRSRGVFHGRILVQPEAQKTDAKQTNKNLLLSDEATANTKPQLEIYADDVKCTHGATIGQLNDESIFYLRARGLGLETARRMLIHAFAGEITERIQYEPVREELDELIWNRLEQNPQIAAGPSHV